MPLPLKQGGVMAEQTGTLVAPKHLITARQFDRAAIDLLLGRAAEMRETHDRSGLSGRIMASLFYEPSTRTRLSFESAMVRLGGSVIGTESAGQFSSAAKGETLEDTIRVVSAYADVIVLRHPATGAAQRAAEVAAVPVINAGDGAGEHPTQALLDLFTIATERGSIDGTEIAFCGDLRHGRTVHSLIQMIAKYRDITMHFVAPPEFQLDAELQALLRGSGVKFDCLVDIDQVVGVLDVLYQTRVQTERLDPELKSQAPRGLRVDPELMKRLPRNAIVMHPLPRVDEIDPKVDSDPRAAYFRQAINGATMRMAILEWVLS